MKLKLNIKKKLIQQVISKVYVKNVYEITSITKIHTFRIFTTK